MTYLRIRARENMGKGWIRLYFRFFLGRIVMLLSLIAFLPCLMGHFYSADDIFPVFSPLTGKIFLCVLGFCSVFLFVYSVILTCFAEGSVFYLSDKNTGKPINFFCFSQGMRFLVMKMQLLFYKLMWGIIFFMPSLTLAVFLFLNIKDGEMIYSLFVTLSVSLVLLFITGLCFYIVCTRRYYLCSFLFFLNPLTPSSEIIRSSEYFMRGRNMKLIIHTLPLFLWKIFSFIPLCDVFSYVYIKSIRVLMCERLYGEKKCFSKKSAVVFYISRKSIMKNVTASY